MATEIEKAQIELAIFANFIRFSGLPIPVSTAEKRNPPEPDILCSLGTEGKVAFELVEICDPNIARALADPKPNLDGVEYISTSDPSLQIVGNKLRKVYQTSHPVELLCYTNGRVITPSDVIVPTILPLLDCYRHTFRKAWLLSEGEVFKVWG